MALEASGALIARTMAGTVLPGHVPYRAGRTSQEPWSAAFGISLLLLCFGCAERALPGPGALDLAGGADLAVSSPHDDLAFVEDLETEPVDLARPLDLTRPLDFAPSTTITRVWACQRDSFITVSWTPVADAIGYRIYTSTMTPVALVPGNAISAASPGIEVPATNGVMIHIVVTAELSSGETAPSSEVSATPLAITLPHDELWTSSGVTFTQAALEAWDSVSTIPNSAADTRVVTGSSTGLAVPEAASVAVDPLRGTVYVSDSKSGHLAIWDFVAASMSGDLVPSRTLLYNSLPIANPQYANSPSGVALDGKRQILYVAEENEINVYLDACHANGTPPDGEVSGADTMLFAGVTHQIQVDEARDDLYVVTDSEVLVFHPASALAAGGDIAPTRVIQAPGNSPFITSVWLDSSADELYVGDQSARCIYVVPGASTVDGTIQPSTIVSTASPPVYPTALAGGGGFLFDAEGSSLRMWSLDSVRMGTFSDLKDLTKTVGGSFEGVTYLP